MVEKKKNKTSVILNESGATAPEYAILVSLIAGVIIIAVTALGLSVSSLFATLRWW